MTQDARSVVAEFVGTFFFVTLGAGVIVTDQMMGGKLGLPGIALCHGLALSLAVTATMRVSGGHLNPAVTVAMLTIGKIKPTMAGAYIIGQLLASLLAGAVLVSIFDKSVWDPVHLGTPALAAGVGVGLGVWVEIILTFFLIFAIMGTAVYAKSPIQIGGFGVGLTILADILVGGPVTGASMNPARSFGPAFISGFTNNHWVYWVGPIIGAVLAANIYYHMIADPAER
ncbi:MAG TPA: aquaporin [Candidatus Acidoferrales bacterium]|nr:aquaporin [Candidatus Acidoferrales bacterium]